MGKRISDIEIAHWFLAMAHNDRDSAHVLRDAGVPINTTHPHLQMTGLMLASRMGHEALVDWLLAEGAAPSIQMGPHYQTALHLALEHAHLGCAQYLLESEANPNLRDSLGRTPLHYAVHSDTNPLTPEIRTQAIHLLIRYKANTDIPDLEGATPLHYSVIYGRNECMEHLLRAGADPNAQTYEIKLTPCHIALIEDQEEATALLLAGGANPDLPTALGWTVRGRLPAKWHIKLQPALSSTQEAKPKTASRSTGLRKTQKVANSSTHQ